MKIAINLIPFSSVQGVEIYSQNIIKNFLEADDNDFFIFASEDLPSILDFSRTKTIKIELKKKYSKAIWQQFNIYYYLKKYDIDILFSPVPSAPVFYKNKIVVIHDCAYDRFREFDNFLSKIYFKMMYYSAKYYSKKIITVSNFSKKELINLYKINKEKILVTHGAVPELQETNEAFDLMTLEKFNICKPYFFCVGSNRPRKNIIGVMKAFRLFLEKTKLNYLLVITGKIDKRFLDLTGEIKKNGMKDSVILTDFVGSKEKVSLYKKSKALLFPSFYEGFGLPILEAQSLGVPVLTSNVSAMPEVAGKSALFVDPYDTEDIMRGMEKIVFDETLRKELIQKGYENLKRFSWKKSAKKLIGLLGQV